MLYHSSSLQMDTHHLISSFSLLLLCLTTTCYSIGVNYGTIANNLPPPADVANFLNTKTTINSVKLFDANPDILHAFADTGISVAITVGNGDIVGLADIGVARQWIATNVQPFPRTKINYILVGSEVLHWGETKMIFGLVPAMRTLNQALVQTGLTGIKVTTAHSLAIMASSQPPSLGRFRPGFAKRILGPMLRLLRDTKSPFMVNPYPYFGYSPQMANYALFKDNPGVRDPNTGLVYSNMFHGLMDAVHSAMKAIGYVDVDIAIGETGWPSNCDGYEACSVANAGYYNSHVIDAVSSGKGTPLMPSRRFETYLFALFNENLKPGPTAERNWGLFQPDFTPVYDCGVMTNGQPGGQQQGNPIRDPNPRRPRSAPSLPAPTPVQGKKWCVPKAEATPQHLQANIDYVCSQGVDCKPIQAGGSCFMSNDVKHHATYAMNVYYQTKGRNDFNCDFSHTGVVTTVDPSHGTCQLVA